MYELRLGGRRTDSCAVPGEFQGLRGQHDVSHGRAGLIDVVSWECNGHFRCQLASLSLKIEQVQNIDHLYKVQQMIDLGILLVP